MNKSNRTRERISRNGVSHTTKCLQRSPLDSGYESDISSPSKQPVFNSESEEFGSDWIDNFKTMDLDNDVFVNNRDEISAFDGYDTADQEVEDIFCGGQRMGLGNGERSANFHRPSAPVPVSQSSDTDKCDCHCMTILKHTSLPCRKHYFSPINDERQSESRFDFGHSESAFRRHSSDTKTCGGVSCRQRTRSECTHLSGHLPDVVPSTYRPVSLPDIVSLGQNCGQEMGRELRRIGDEFETVFRDRNKSKVQVVSWSFFNCSLTVHLSGYLSTIRRVLSPSPHEIVDAR